MPIFNNQLAGASGAAGGGYQIKYAARLGTDHSFLKATTDFVGTGNSNYYTVSFWAKRCGVSTNDMVLHSSSVGGSTYYSDYPVINASADKLVHYYGTNASAFTAHTSSAVFRDPSAWTHWCIKNDNGVLTYYANNEVVLTFTHGGSYRYLIANSYDYRINTHEYQSTPNGIGDWYIADYYLILDSAFGASDIYGPDQFGEYNNDGVWVPKENSLSTAQFGEDGCFMEFKQSGTSGATASDIGADTSGNDNHMRLVGSWTSDDQVTDTPSNNFATLNPLNMSSSGGVTLKDGNLNADATGTATDVMATIFVNSGKYYVEYQINTADSSTSNPVTGIQGVGFPTSPKANIDRNGGYDYDGTTGTLSPAFTYTTSDVVMMAFDVDAKKIWFGKNGTWYNSGDPGAGTGETLSWAADGAVAPYVRSRNSSDVTVNFGQLGFDHPSPTGFSALSTANLPTPAIADGSAYFQTTLYTGDGNATQTITQSENSTFNPDLVWIKNRSNAYSHNVNDAVRGYTGASPATYTDVKVLATNATDPEGLGVTLTTAQQRGFVQASTANGFIVNKGTAGSQDGYYTNASGHTYAAWQWLAANGTASNSDGSITSTVSANTTSGFSIVTYTGGGGTGTVGHGLGQAPNFLIVKSRDTANSWYTGSDEYASWEYYQALNLTLAQSAGSTAWNSTAPTSSVFSIGASVNTSSENYIAYCWHSVEGFSKFGKYTGNGSTDGSFVWCGFRPAWFMTKRVDSGSESWVIQDTARSPYNLIDQTLLANATNAEISNTAYYADILSNGFKIRASHSARNASGGTYIFMAFAEHPFGGDNVSPVPAR